MRILLIFFCAFVLFANTDTSIKKNESKLQDISNQQNAISAKLKSLGKNINEKNAKIKELDKEIARLNKSISANEAIYIEQESVYKEFESKKNALIAQQEKLQAELIDTILKDMAIVMMLNADEPLDSDSIMSEEILKNLSEGAKRRIDSIIREQEIIAIDMRNAEGKIESSKKVITSQQQKKSALERAKKEQMELAKKMQVELDSYNNELKRLDSEQKSIQKILVDLKIVKKREQAKSEIKTQGGVTPPIEVRQIGNSYHNVSTAKYSGAKTIAPLKTYKIETKYGPYFDPVYKMRVFNEFITMRVDNKSAVMSVLDGKIVFAKETPVLKKVVVIEHKNSLHTIYSSLDEISSNIKVGSNIKKGETIAFVKDRLNFEVTQKDKHINPLDLINAK